MDVTVDKKYKCSRWKKIYYPIYRRWNWFIDIPQEVKWFIQRGKRGYADCDVWGLDGYLCSWMPNALRDLKEQSSGNPGTLKSEGEWHDTLDKIAMGFESAESLNNLDFFNVEDKKEVWMPKKQQLEKNFDRGMNLFKTYFFNLWD